MHVVATAGHVDHGKSTLVRVLTGMDPDRLKEEHQRGLSIALGYCWATLPEVGEVAFVDVPGHERFIATTLAGLGPVPGVLFVVAADDPWMPQAAEHLAALDALGVTRGVLAVTRADLSDPAPARAAAQAAMAGTSLAGIPAVAVSGRTGDGMDELRALLVEMVGALPQPDPVSDVRLWVDRCFHVKGAGTVVTGTLPAGTVGTGDTLTVAPGGEAAGARQVRVRSVQSLGRPVEAAHGVARVALNVAGASEQQLRASGVLVSPDRWWFTAVADVRVEHVQPGVQRVPQRPLLHLGATSTATRLRPLGEDTARLHLDRGLPLRIGDRGLLRDPGSRTVWGVTVLDPAPPALRMRGAARARAEELASHSGIPDEALEVRSRGVVRRSLLDRMGVPLGQRPAHGVLVAGDWAVSGEKVAQWRRRLPGLVAEFETARPLEAGMPVPGVVQALGLPAPELLEALVADPLRLVDGRVTGRTRAVLPGKLEQALARLDSDLAEHQFAAPTADRLRELGLDTRAVAAAAKAGRLLRLADGIVLLPGADRLAVQRLAELPQPFTTSQARVALDTSRRVVLPLLAHLDRTGRSIRHPDDRRSLRGTPDKVEPQ